MAVNHPIAVINGCSGVNIALEHRFDEVLTMARLEYQISKGP